MSILDVTEEQIFHTLGRGRDPNFKPIEKVRPLQQPKKARLMRRDRPVVEIQPQSVRAIEKQPEHSHIDESMIKLASDLDELNNRIAGLQKMVKWYMMPQLVVVLVLFLALVIKT